MIARPLFSIGSSLQTLRLLARVIKTAYQPLPLKLLAIGIRQYLAHGDQIIGLLYRRWSL